jgi:hypothetical protein
VPILSRRNDPLPQIKTIGWHPSSIPYPATD